MTRTEHDLRAALATREQFAPDADSVMTGLQDGHRRRPLRTVGITVAAVAAAAAIATPAVLVNLGGGASPQSSSPAPPGATVADPAQRPDFSFTVSSTTVAGYQLVPAAIGPHAQIFALIPAGGTVPAAELDLAPAGEPSRFDDTPNTQVNGSSAHVETTGSASWLGWQYAPDAYARLFTLDGAAVLPEATLVAIAEAIPFVDPYPATVPLTLSYLPAGAPLLNLTYPTGGTVRFGAQFVGDGIALDVTISTQPLPGYGYEPATLAGESGDCATSIDGMRCQLAYGDLFVSIGSVNPSITLAEFSQIFDGLTLADLDDRATWVTPEDAFP